MSGQFPDTFYRVSVKGLVLDGEGSPLVIQEDQDVWSLPGGGLNHGEKPNMALEREFLEELGVRVKIGEITTVRTFMHPNGQVCLMWLVYGVELEEQDFKLGQGVDRAEFVPVGELRDDDPFEAMVKDVCKSVSN